MNLLILRDTDVTYLHEGSGGGVEGWRWAEFFFVLLAQYGV